MTTSFQLPLRLVGMGAGLALVTIASSAFAKDGNFICQTWHPTKASPAVTHCLTWSKTGAARLKAEGCDPSTMGASAMRSKCREMTATPATPANG